MKAGENVENEETDMKDNEGIDELSGADNNDKKCDTLQKEHFKMYVLKNELTPRESDVLRCILTSEDSMRNIAASLEISERMFFLFKS